MKKNICENVINNPKEFKNVNNRRKTNISISQLYKPNVNKKVYCEADYDKAEALASQFSNVYTIEGYPGKKIFLIANLLSVLMLQPY